jgi:hypothetical protein
MNYGEIALVMERLKLIKVPTAKELHAQHFQSSDRSS